MPTLRALWRADPDGNTIRELVGGLPVTLLAPEGPQRAGMGLFRSGPHAGSASLFLDGWSTSAVAAVPRMPTNVVTLAAWFAPRVLLGTAGDPVIGIVDLRGEHGGILLGHDRAGRLVGSVTGAGAIAREELAGPEIPVGRWSHLAVSVNVARGRLALFLQGELVAEREVPPFRLDLPEEMLLARTRGSTPLEGVVTPGMPAGLLGDVTLSEGLPALAAVPPDALRPDLAPRRSRFDADRDRPRFHLMPAQGWMNEPHGALKIDGRHHVFFQHNPTGPYWSKISWGHMVSDDLARWTELPPALAPSVTGPAPDGVWSGSSVAGAGGEHLLFFTAGDLGRFPNQSIGVARPDGSVWAPSPHTVVEQPASSPGVSEPLVAGEFRDPFVWRELDRWFMLVGSGFRGRGGAALLYTSTDGDRWEQRPPLLIGDEGRYPATGSMWELPVLLPVGDPDADGQRRAVVLVAPWFPGPSQHHLQYVWHWLGVWDPAAAAFTPDSESPRHFDAGGRLTGPSGTVLPDGRSVLWTIAQDERSLRAQVDSGWAHNAGLPLELGEHPDRTLSIRPVAELTLLRERLLLELKDPDPQGAETAAGQLSLAHAELEVDVELRGGALELALRVSADGVERTVLRVDACRHLVEVDRSVTSRAAERCEAPRSLPFEPSELTRLRVFVDGSMIEAYLDDRVSITTRAYPTAGDAAGVRLSLPPRARVHRLAAFQLSSAFPPPNERP